jgi:hypothetical protein
VGFLLALRLPKLPIGWIALIAVLIAMLQDIAKTYLLYAYRFHHGALVFTPSAIVVAVGLSLVPVLLLAAAIVLFPDGKPQSPCGAALGAFLSLSLSRPSAAGASRPSPRLARGSAGRPREGPLPLRPGRRLCAVGRQTRPRSRLRRNACG